MISLLIESTPHVVSNTGLILFKGDKWTYEGNTHNSFRIIGIDETNIIYQAISISGKTTTHRLNKKHLNIDRMIKIND